MSVAANNAGKPGVYKRIVNKIGSKMFTLLILFIIIVAIFSIWAAVIGENFLRWGTFEAIGEMMVLTSFLAIGSGFLMVSGNLDLSASAIGAFSSVMTAAALSYWGLPSGVAIPLAILTGTMFGIVNAVLVYEFNFAPFIGTMAMASVVRGIMQFVSINPVSGTVMSVNYANDVTRWIGGARLLSFGEFRGFPAMLILAFIVFTIYGLILAKTKFGMKVYLVGANRQAAQLTGISPRKMYYTLFANSAFLASIAGVIHTGRQSQGDLNAMLGNQFTGLIAAILGGVSFGGGSGHMAGVFIGILLLNTFTMGTTIVRFNIHLRFVFEGVLLLLALGLDYYHVRKKQKELMKAN